MASHSADALRLVGFFASLPTTTNSGVWLRTFRDALLAYLGDVDRMLVVAPGDASRRSFPPPHQGGEEPEAGSVPAALAPLPVPPRHCATVSHSPLHDCVRMKHLVPLVAAVCLAGCWSARLRSNHYELPPASVLATPGIVLVVETLHRGMLADTTRAVRIIRSRAELEAWWRDVEGAGVPMPSTIAFDDCCVLVAITQGNGRGDARGMLAYPAYDGGDTLRLFAVDRRLRPGCPRENVGRSPSMLLRVGAAGIPRHVTLETLYEQIGCE